MKSIPITGIPVITVYTYHRYSCYHCLPFGDWSERLRWVTVSLSSVFSSRSWPAIMGIWFSSTLFLYANIYNLCDSWQPLDVGASDCRLFARETKTYYSSGLGCYCTMISMVAFCALSCLHVIIIAGIVICHATKWRPTHKSWDSHDQFITSNLIQIFFLTCLAWEALLEATSTAS